MLFLHPPFSKERRGGRFLSNVREGTTKETVFLRMEVCITVDDDHQEDLSLSRGNLTLFWSHFASDRQS